MNASDKTKGRGSAGTSATAPHANPHSPSTEAEYIARQTAEARAAISNTINAISGDMKDTVDVRLWTRQYPWLAVGAAVCAGFAAACAVVPSKEEEEKLTLEALAKRLKPKFKPEPLQTPDGTDGDNAQAYATGRRSFWTSIALELISVVRPLLMSALTAGLAAKAAQPEQPPENPENIDV